VVYGSLRQYFLDLNSRIVVFSDGDEEIERTFAAIFPNAAHFLCRFHIAQNIGKHKHHMQEIFSVKKVSLSISYVCNEVWCWDF
jgi:transposase-like protein